MSEYEDDFKKIYVFKSSGQSVIPKKIFECEKWTVPELLIKKQELNRVKSSLGKYKLKVWTKHTSNRDRAGFVMKNLSENIQPELLTQAWCKFYEILGQFPVVPLCAVSDRKLNSLHLCEAPGAFVCALNHYLTLNYSGLKWNWTASTLNPYYEGNNLSQMIPDDRFIKHTLSRWNFGADFSGDITMFHNHEHLVHYFKENKTKVSLVTADGSVDCMKNPGEQERNVECLQFCETMTALPVLQTGGAFVLKIFTMFEESTINLLFLLNCLFEKVSVYKPCTSKSGNSEVYVVCTNFKGFACLQHLWSRITMVYKDKNLFSLHSMFYKDEIPPSFLEEVTRCSEFFMKKQIHTILDNIYKFENKTRDDIYMTKSFIAIMYINKYELKPIPNNKKIVPDVNVGEDWSIHSGRKKKGFTRLDLNRLIGQNKISDILHMVTGKRITNVYNSRFTYADNLKKLSEIASRANETSELYNRVLSLLSVENIVMNYADFHLVSFHDVHKVIFTKVFHSLDAEKNLILMNFPLVTQFMVGLLYILFFMFDDVYFGNCIIILNGPKSDKKHEVHAIFSRIQREYEILHHQNLNSDFDGDILQIVASSLVDSFLMENIWNYNNRLFCLDQCYSRPFGHIQLNT